MSDHQESWHEFGLLGQATDIVWTYIPNYLSIDSDCVKPDAKTDAEVCNQIVAISFLSLLFAEIIVFLGKF